ncbi:hypothetical protein GCM10020255_022940 [Rhodococcus baikonurensis]
MTDQPTAVSEEPMTVADAYHDANGQPIMAESIVIYIDALATKVYWEQESDPTKLEFVRDWVRQFNEFRENLALYRGLNGELQHRNPHGCHVHGQRGRHDPATARAHRDPYCTR